MNNIPTIPKEHLNYPCNIVPTFISPQKTDIFSSSSSSDASDSDESSSETNDDDDSENEILSSENNTNDKSEMPKKGCKVKKPKKSKKTTKPKKTTISEAINDVPSKKPKKAKKTTKTTKIDTNADIPVKKPKKVKKTEKVQKTVDNSNESPDKKPKKVKKTKKTISTTTFETNVFTMKKPKKAKKNTIDPTSDKPIKKPKKSTKQADTLPSIDIHPDQNNDFEYKKKNIPKPMKIMMWDTHVGSSVGETLCFCCNYNKVSQMSFDCGHIQSEKCGGKTEVSNLVPICRTCNSSMKAKNMLDYMNEFGFEHGKARFINGNPRRIVMPNLI